VKSARVLGRILLAAAAALLPALETNGQQQSSAWAQGSVSASVVPALSLTKSQDLVLGEFRPGDAPGTVELDVPSSSPAASRASSGGVALAGSTFSAAQFSISSHTGAPAHFDVVLPGTITLQRVGGPEVMTVDAFRSRVRQECRDGGAASDGCAGAPYTLLVGATLHVDSGQKAGRYVGTFTVTVNQL
jgi:hypothetical protein